MFYADTENQVEEIETEVQLIASELPEDPLQKNMDTPPSNKTDNFPWWLLIFLAPVLVIFIAFWVFRHKRKTKS